MAELSEAVHGGKINSNEAAKCELMHQWSSLMLCLIYSSLFKMNVS